MRVALVTGANTFGPRTPEDRLPEYAVCITATVSYRGTTLTQSFTAKAK